MKSLWFVSVLFGFLFVAGCNSCASDPPASEGEGEGESPCEESGCPQGQRCAGDDHRCHPTLIAGEGEGDVGEGEGEGEEGEGEGEGEPTCDTTVWCPDVDGDDFVDASDLTRCVTGGCDPPAPIYQELTDTNADCVD